MTGEATSAIQCLPAVHKQFVAPSVIRVVFILQVIPVVPPLPGDGDQGKQCLFLFWLRDGHNGTFIFPGKFKPK